MIDEAKIQCLRAPGSGECISPTLKGTRHDHRGWPCTCLERVIRPCPMPVEVTGVGETK